MNEYNEVQRLVAESYRTKIDAEELRREVKALLNEAIKQKHMSLSTTEEEYWHGMYVAYNKVLRIIDEKEKNA